MTTATLLDHPGVTQSAATPRGKLALAFQEAFTVAVRLRAGRQVPPDAESFRAHIKQLIARADERARAAGYDGNTARDAAYAFVALLDESVLTSSQPIFAQWSQQPLQEELFGENIAGENFFRTVHDLLGQQDSDSLADLLEVYQLCLMLGFHGRYGGSDSGALSGVMSAIEAKLRRIRGAAPAELVPGWQLPAQETVALGRDPWARRLWLVAGGALVFALALYIICLLLLRSDVAELQALL